MTQTTTHDRDAINPQALAQAVRIYVRSTNRDERDIALESALLEQGVMNPSEVIEQIESDAFGAIIFFEHGDIIFVDIEGDVASVTRD